MSSSKLATRIISHPETTEFIRQDVWSPFNQPREDAGETLVAEILTDMGIEWWYEPFFYPLAFNEEGSVSFGFRPDFWLPLDPATGQLSKRVTASVSGCTVPMGSFEEEVVRNRRGIHTEVTGGLAPDAKLVTDEMDEEKKKGKLF